MVKAILAVAVALVATVVIIIGLFSLIPWVGTIVLAAMVGAALLLVGLALGLPVLIVLAVLFRLIMLPFEFLWWLVWGRTRNRRTRMRLT
jgi:hypothetical protein